MGLLKSPDGNNEGYGLLPNVKESYQIISFQEQKQLVDGIVREGFLKDGLLAIRSTPIVQRLKEIGGFDIVLPITGYYVNKNVIPELSEESQRLWNHVFRVLQNEYGITNDRVLVVSEGVGDAVVQHELIHDVLYSRPREQREQLVRYVYDSNRFPGEMLLKMKTVGELYVASSDMDMMSHGVGEFTCKFFAGQWDPNARPVWDQRFGWNRYEYSRKEDAEYIRDNAPEELKRTYYELGLIWPSSKSK